MFGKNQTRWYIYTWVLFSTHVWILTHMYGKRHTCVKKATQLYDCKCLAFSTHVWEKPPTCLFPPELSVHHHHDQYHHLHRHTDLPNIVPHAVAQHHLLSSKSARVAVSNTIFVHDQRMITFIKIFLSFS